MYVTIGRREVLADDGIALVERLRLINMSCRIQLDEADQEAHDFILLEGLMEEVGDATNRMKDWFKSIILAGQ
ncbi:hypothetical protein HRG_012073 [Hirsutella rhossiliensis]